MIFLLSMTVCEWLSESRIIKSHKGAREQILNGSVLSCNISKIIDEDVSLPLYVIATKKIDNWEHAAKYASVYTATRGSVFKKMGHINPAIK